MQAETVNMQAGTVYMQAETVNMQIETVYMQAEKVNMQIETVNMQIETVWDEAESSATCIYKQSDTQLRPFMLAVWHMVTHACIPTKGARYRCLEHAYPNGRICGASLIGPPNTCIVPLFLLSLQHIQPHGRVLPLRANAG
jgi:hypothetical protein